MGGTGGLERGWGTESMDGQAQKMPPVLEAAII